jgi:hypothetical protein
LWHDGFLTLRRFLVIPVWHCEPQTSAKGVEWISQHAPQRFNQLNTTAFRWSEGVELRIVASPTVVHAREKVIVRVGLGRRHRIKGTPLYLGVESQKTFDAPDDFLAFFCVFRLKDRLTNVVLGLVDD